VERTLQRLLLLSVVGLAAQLIDGALGMAYGVTSSTLLLILGVAPAWASASVHLSEIVTTLASGASHWRFGNIDWSTVRRIALPGGLGAFLSSRPQQCVRRSRQTVDGRSAASAGSLYSRPFYPGTQRHAHHDHDTQEALPHSVGTIWRGSSTPLAAVAGDQSLPHRCWPPGGWSRER
jgi:hypothetical protein